jgi:hypothetical protein
MSALGAQIFEWGAPVRPAAARSGTRPEGARGVLELQKHACGSRLSARLFLGGFGFDLERGAGGLGDAGENRKPGPHYGVSGAGRVCPPSTKQKRPAWIWQAAFALARIVRRACSTRLKKRGARGGRWPPGF